MAPWAADCGSRRTITACSRSALLLRPNRLNCRFRQKRWCALLGRDNMAQPPMPPHPLSATAEIVAFSRRQAMDWSLVLASQGIESTIDHAQDRDRWLLLVEPHELERARESIRLYRAENRGWSWRQELPG